MYRVINNLSVIRRREKTVDESVGCTQGASSVKDRRVVPNRELRNKRARARQAFCKRRRLRRLERCPGR